MKKIMFVGASGYGNIGDDSYRELFSENLPEFECYFDSPYPDTSYMDKMDLLVIGGGGLIYDEPGIDHLNYMAEYIKAAQKIKIPYCFVSCGLQFDQYNYYKAKDKVSFGVESLKRWKELLEGAEFISVRSKMCKAIIDALIGKGETTHFVPDLAYLMTPCSYHLTGKIDYLFLPKDDSAFDDRFMEIYLRHTKDNVLLLAMAKSDWEGINFIRKKISPHANLKDRLMVSPRQAARVIADSGMIVTSRYHGAILARAVGKREDEIKVLPVSYKNIVEERPENLQDAWKNINLIKEFMGVA